MTADSPVAERVPGRAVSWAHGGTMDPHAPPLILIVEDETDLAATCERLLRRRGHAVVTVASRAAALATLGGVSPSLVISDVRLPDGDGLDVVRAATAMRPRVPALVMTARPSQTNCVAAHAAGAVGYLAKPFTAATFAGVVDRILTSAAV
jgi:two-component system response regulator PrrA